MSKCRSLPYFSARKTASFSALFPVLALCLLVAPSALLAQPCAVHLANGDSVQGELQTLTDGVLKVESPWGGVLEIDFSQVQRLETSGDVTVVLTSEETLAGRLTTTDSGQLEMASGTDRPRPLAFGDIAAINPPASEPRFSGTLSAGANIQTGNSDQQTLTAAVHLQHKKEKNVFKFDLRWVDAEQSGVTTASSTFGAFKYDRQINDKFYFYGSLEALEDEFRDLDLRTIVSAGAGYHWLTGERRTWSLEGGVSYFSRDYISIPDEDEITVRLASYFAWQLAENFWLRDELVLFPSFDQESLNFRNELSLTTTLLANWAVEFANVLDYDGEPPPGIEKEDWLWILSLNYGF